MSKRIREHIRSNVVGYIALFIALSGTAYATHPGGANTISSADIIDGAVHTTDINDKDGVRSADVVDDTEAGGGLKADDLAPGSVGSSEIADRSVAGRHIVPNAVTGARVADNNLTAEDVGVFWAVVSFGGSVVRSSGGVTGTRPATGDYRVDFGRDVRNCAYVATPFPGGTTIAAFSPVRVPADTVQVRTEFDTIFSLVVAC